MAVVLVDENKVKKSEIYVYIGGKYSAKSMHLTELNILKAQEFAIKCAEIGVNYYCPHTHTRLMDFYAPNVPYEYWTLQDNIIIKKLCNCMIALDNWADSPGTKMEIALCGSLDYPVFYAFDEFLSWYNNLEESQNVENYQCDLSKE